MSDMEVELRRVKNALADEIALTRKLQTLNHRLEVERDQANTRIAEVLNWHKLQPETAAGTLSAPVCMYCYWGWPCPTRLALTGGADD